MNQESNSYLLQNHWFSYSFEIVPEY